MVGDFTTAEADGDFDFVFVFEEADNIFELDVVIADVGGRAQFDFLGLNLFGIFFLLG